MITVDKNAAYPQAIEELIAEEELYQNVELRQKKYLNNIIELSASGNKTISQTWHGIRLIQFCKANVEGIRNNEHDQERSNFLD